MFKKIDWREVTIDHLDQETSLTGFTKLGDIWEVALRIFKVLFPEKRSVYEDLSVVKPQHLASMQDGKSKATKVIETAARTTGQRQFNGTFKDPIVLIQETKTYRSGARIKFLVLLECHSTGRGLVAIKTIFCTFEAIIRAPDNGETFYIAACRARPVNNPNGLDRLYEASLLEAIRAEQIAYQHVFKGGLPGLGKNR